MGNSSVRWAVVLTPSRPPRRFNVLQQNRRYTAIQLSTGETVGLFTRKVPSYEFSRLGFKADVIEPLAPNDRFRIITPEGTFEMTKAEFYRDFANGAATMSYRERGLYHYPRTPEKALKYLR